MSINIAAMLMVKDESARILVTLKSVLQYVACFIILDTGSTDNTIELIENFCRENAKPLYLIEATFVDFSTSRNVLLDYADKITDMESLHYLLLLDSNDELQNGDNLVYLAEELLERDISAYHVKQQWLGDGVLIEYWNVRFIKPKCGWLYSGPIHEHIYNKYDESLKDNCYKLDGPVLFQDRAFDDAKSCKRFPSDKEILYREYLKDPTNPRTVIYLAETCDFLGQYDESYKYFEERYNIDSFPEERFHSAYVLGNLSQHLGKPWHIACGWYMAAFQISRRAEPVLRISGYYFTNKQYDLAYLFAKIACELPYPTESILFVDRSCYDYGRYHLLGAAAYPVGHYQEGERACMLAIKARNNDIDNANLKLYLERTIDDGTANSI